MQKIKAKRGSFWQTQMLPFVLVWTLGIGIIGIASRVWQSIPLPFLYNAPEARVTLSLITSVISTGLAQVFLVERLLKKSMRGWMLYTTASIIVTLLLNHYLPVLFWGPRLSWPNSFDVYKLLINLTLNAPTSLIQALWLQKRVERAWLWPLLTIPLLVAFTAIPYGESNYQVLKMITLLSVGVVQAGLMHYFWQPKDIEKTKVDHAIDDGANQHQDRLERLQERESHNPLWDRGDEQALQSEA